MLYHKRNEPVIFIGNFRVSEEKHSFNICSAEHDIKAILHDGTAHTTLGIKLNFDQMRNNNPLIYVSGIAVFGVVLFLIKLIILCTEGMFI